MQQPLSAPLFSGHHLSRAPRLVAMFIAPLLLALFALGMASEPAYAAAELAAPKPLIHVQGINLPTVTIVGSSPNPAPIMAPVTYTVTVTGPGGSVPTGVVNLLQANSAGVGGGMLDTNGVAIITAPNIFGQRIITLTANYSGDINYPPATSAAYIQTFYQLTPQIMLVSSASTSTLSETVTLTATATLTTTPMGFIPSGSITFYSGTQPLCSAIMLPLLPAACATHALTIGSHTLTAVYAGDMFFQSATSNALNHTVAQATSVLEVAAYDAVLVGESVTLSATVTPVTTTNPMANMVCDPMNPITCTPPCIPTCGPILCPPNCPTPPVLPPAPKMPTPTGEVVFKDGSRTLCTAIVDSEGKAACETSLATAGQHSLKAIYGGDINYEGSRSPLSLTVLPAATQLTVTPAASNVVQGEPVAFDVTVAAVAPGAGMPSGEVTIGAGSNICVAQLTDGVGSCNLTFDTAGSHAISATYAGNSNFSTSSASTRVIVVAKAVEIMLSIPTGKLTAGQPLTLTAQVAQVDAAGATNAAAACGLSGDVAFRDNDTLLGTVPLAADCTATLVITSLSAGTHSFSAIYAGASTADNATSQPVPVTIDSPTGLDTPAQPRAGQRIFLPALAN